MTRRESNVMCDVDQAAALAHRRRHRRVVDVTVVCVGLTRNVRRLRTGLWQVMSPGVMARMLAERKKKIQTLWQSGLPRAAVQVMCVACQPARLGSLRHMKAAEGAQTQEAATARRTQQKAPRRQKQNTVRRLRGASFRGSDRRVLRRRDEGAKEAQMARARFTTMHPKRS